MKKLYCLLLLSFMLLTSSTAQDWSLINFNDQFHYQRTGTDYISNTLMADSFFVNSTDTFFYLNRIVTKAGTYNSWPLLKSNSPQFLNRMAKKAPYGVWVLHDPDTMILMTHAKLGNSWVLRQSPNIIASVQSISASNVFGQADTIKTISLSTGDSIVLSKSFGILWFPELDSTGGFELVGIGGRDVGFVLPDFHDFFDFKTGDVFQHEISSGWHRKGINYGWERRKLEVLSVTSYPDSVVAVCERHSVGVYIHNSFAHHDTIVWKHNRDIESACDMAPNSFLKNWPYGVQPPNPFDYHLAWVSADTLNGYGRKFYMDGLQDSSLGNWVMQQFNEVVPTADPDLYITNGNTGGMTYSYFKEYRTGLGLTYAVGAHFESSDRFMLTAWVKDNDTTGIILPDSSFVVSLNENVIPEIEMAVFPNPAETQINIDFNSHITGFLSLMDLQGRLLYEEQIDGNASIDVEGLPRGLYLLRVESEPGVAVRKIILR